MKKIITLVTIVLVSLSINSFAQSHKKRFSPSHSNSNNSNKADAMITRLDSTYGFGWDNTIGWSAYFKGYPTYNNDSTENNTIELVLNQNNVWENGYKTSYIYDMQKNVSTELSQEWDANTSSWVNTNQVLYTYNANNYRTTTTNQIWQSGAWVNNNRYIYNFDANNRASLDVYQSWNTGTNVWDSIVRNLYTYNAKNLADSALTQYWNGTTKVWISYILITKTYDGNNNLISNLSQSFDITTNAWKNSTSNTYNYDANKNKLTDWHKTWNAGGTWDNTELDTYTYDSDNNIVSELYQDWSLLNKNWLNTDSAHYYYTKKNGPNTGIATIYKSENNLNIYPNPASQFVNINFNAAVSDHLTLINILGEVVYSQNYIANQSIDLTGFTKGIYIVKVGNQTQKLIIE
jgi:hypothetical protein